MKTQVAIVGAGPAGLLLGQLLHANGIDSVILERHDRTYVEGRIRAGVLEQGTVNLLDEAGVGTRCAKQGMVHGGIEISNQGERQRIDFVELTGKSVTVYGQTEVTKDLIVARLACGQPLIFEAQDVRPSAFDGDAPRVAYRHNGVQETLDCDFIAGCDGFHGVCRQSIPADALTVYEQTYPFTWLGILSASKPASSELVYASHERGFALFSMRGPEVSRSYLQCRADTTLDDWPDEKVWDELRLRLGGQAASALPSGPVLDKSITSMRSFVAEPLRHGRLFLAGDAGHIVPPTGAKGLNLAASDVHYLACALTAFYRHGDSCLLEQYSATALQRIWKAQRFSWWMTKLLHTVPDATAYEKKVQAAELEYVLSSRAAMTALAENYVGLPY